MTCCSQHSVTHVCANLTLRLAGLLASSVYIKLVVLPGSAAFKIYNPELFLHCCRVLNKWNASGTLTFSKSKRKSSLSPLQRSQPSQKRKRGRGKERTVTQEKSSDFVDGDDGDSDIDQESLEENMLTPAETRQLTSLMRSLLMDVLLVCEKYSMRQSESTAIQLLSVLINFAKVHCERISEEMGHWGSGMDCSPGILAYKAIHLLCQPFHGHMVALISEAFKHLLDHILMLEDGKVFATIGRTALTLRKQALDFVRYTVTQLGERCIPPLKTLIHHVSFKVPDRQEYRSHAAQVGQRSFVVDLMTLLLETPERVLSADVPTDNAQFATHKSMVCVLLSRCSDSNAGVRSRALVAFSSCTKSRHSDVVDTIKGVITPVTSDPQRQPRRFMPTPKLVIHPQNSDLLNDSRETSETTETRGKTIENENLAGNATPGATTLATTTNTPVLGRASFANIPLTPGFNPYLPDSEGVVSMFHRRVLDTKVVVRKCALQALQSIILFETPRYRPQDLLVLQERCADPALSVRKQAVQSLSELLQACPQNEAIQKAWIFGTLPQVMDRETTVQEKCFDMLEEAILLKLRPLKQGCVADGNEWDLLNVITDEPSEKLRRYLQKACQYWARTKKIKPAMVSAIQSHIIGPNDRAAWMFLAELSKTTVKIDYTFVMNQWKTNADSLQGLSSEACGKWTNVLSVMGTTTKFIPEQTIEDILYDLKERLRQFSYPPPIIAGMVNCVSKLHACTSRETSQRQMQMWGEELMVACDRYMSDIILKAENSPDSQIDEEQMIKYVFTLGEVCQRCPTRIPKRAALLIQSIVAAPCIDSLSHVSSGFSQQTGSSEQNLEQQDSSHEFRDGSNEEQRESHDSQNIQTLSQGSQGSTQPLSQFRGSKMSNTLRAHGFITLGKLCLVDESLGKKTIAALARELEECDSPAVRNNVVVIMGDLTIRYTTLVDRYITNIAACLKDPSALVRKNTLTILTRLLQEEYVKWKGILFFRYITTLLDEVEEIRNLAEFCLEHLLLKKHPNMFFNPFVECIFHFNNYQEHTTYNKFKQTEREREKFTLAGKAHASKRMQMYAFMLDHMTDEQRFKVAAKLNKEILAGVVDKVIPLNDEGSGLLQDSLTVLSCKEIKLSSLRGRGFGSQEEDGEGPVEAQAQAAVTAVAKKVFITQVVRRNVIENIVPVVISLKHMLEKARSPLLKDLMGYLRELMKDYKNEVKDILAADKQLAEEINFDLRTFETQESQQAENAQGSRPTTPQPATHHPSRASSPSQSATSPSQSVASNTSRQSSRATSPLVALSVNAQDADGSPESLATESRESKSVKARRASLTMKDAAKRAMTRVEQLRQSGGFLSPGRKASSPLRSHPMGPSANNKDSSQTASSQMISDENSSMSPARREAQNRAISTPAGNLYNITFGADVDVTMIPPSPIPSLASAMAGGQLCLSPTLQVHRKGDQDIIHMPHPDAKDPKPKKWNIQSPAAKTTQEHSSVNREGTPSRKSHATSRVGLRTRRSKR
ncbi:condensin-2 complex subunit d3-like [Plakobranchus ocellatus]|uniref:Condensin-2 complex subunit d3-like n=1 Tax=Plakobranchus ocellatus TaxID=259542 RepID=A0AAV4A1R7_9GAST|nr:condensin-2 complex subunit d3-like [Plakobranchus ocellatus]